MRISRTFDPRSPRVEAAGRFVEQQQLRIVQQNAGQAQPLLHAPRQVVDQRVDLVRQIGEGQHVVDEPVAVFFRQVIGGGEEMQILADREVFVEAEVIGHIADLAADGGRITADFDAVDFHPAEQRHLQRRQHANRGRLAGSVGADEAEHFSLGNRKRNPADGLDRTIFAPTGSRSRPWGADGRSVDQFGPTHFPPGK